MAKKAWLERNKRKAETVKKYAAIRAELKAKRDYAGPSGPQAILGIPLVRRLKRARGEAMRIWPFETGWNAINEADLAGVELLAAEVMLSLVPTSPAPSESKEQAQVRGLAERLARLDEAGKLSRAFAAPKGVGEDQGQAALEEGWILNV